MTNQYLRGEMNRRNFWMTKKMNLEVQKRVSNLDRNGLYHSFRELLYTFWTSKNTLFTFCEKYLHNCSPKYSVHQFPCWYFGLTSGDPKMKKKSPGGIIFEPEQLHDTFLAPRQGDWNIYVWNPNGSNFAVFLHFKMNAIKPIILHFVFPIWFCERNIVYIFMLGTPYSIPERFSHFSTSLLNQGVTVGQYKMHLSNIHLLFVVECYCEVHCFLISCVPFTPKFPYYFKAATSFSVLMRN